jgi:hypothetical protein
MATPSKRHTNVRSVVFTSTVPTVYTLTGVQSARINPRGEVITHSGDADVFPTTKVLSFQDPQVMVTARDHTVINSLALGTRGTLVLTIDDAKNANTASSGGYTATLSNAILADKSTEATHRQYGQGDLTWEAESTDGITNPLGFAAL